MATIHNLLAGVKNILGGFDSYTFLPVSSHSFFVRYRFLVDTAYYLFGQDVLEKLGVFSAGSRGDWS